MKIIMKKKVDEEANEEAKKKCGVMRKDEEEEERAAFPRFPGLVRYGKLLFPKRPKTLDFMKPLGNHRLAIFDFWLLGNKNFPTWSATCP